MIKQLICKQCGKDLPKGRTRYCSDACARAAKDSRKQVNSGRERGNQQMMWRTTCVSCGAEIFRPVKCIRCKDCQDAYDRRRDAEIKSTGPRRQLGSIDLCQRCGAEYTVESGMQKYCKACSAVATRDSIRAHKRAYAAARRADPEQGEAIRQAKRIVPQKRVCRRCGKAFEARTRSDYCSDACRMEASREYQRAYADAHAEGKAARRREKAASLTREQRDEINARARENYRKRKEREKGDGDA